MTIKTMKTSENEQKQAKIGPNQCEMVQFIMCHKVVTKRIDFLVKGRPKKPLLYVNKKS